MLQLAGGAWEAVLWPARGGALAALRHAGQDLLVPLAGGADPNASWAGAFLMLPWTNRLDEGRLAWPGGTHHFPCDRVAERTALHGLSRLHPWAVEHAAADAAVLVQRLHAPPYHYEARLHVTLGAAFRLSLAVTNLGVEGMPFGSGWHPFFACGPGTRLSFRASGALKRDARNLPVAVVPSHGVEGGEDSFIGLDTHFTGWDGTAALTLPGRRFRLQGEDGWARNLQVFAPPDAGILCVEPVSHVPDAANRPQFATLGAMRALAAGGTMTGGVRIAAA